MSNSNTAYQGHFSIAKEAQHINDGHHFFVDNKGRLVIADHNIDDHEPLSPINAQDGLLYVDFNRPLTKSKHSYPMPLLNRKGHTINTSQTNANPRETYIINRKPLPENISNSIKKGITTEDKTHPKASTQTHIATNKTT